MKIIKVTAKQVINGIIRNVGELVSVPDNYSYKSVDVVDSKTMENKAIQTQKEITSLEKARQEKPKPKEVKVGELK